MYPGTWAARTPDKPALVMAGSGRTLTYGELDERSARLARYLHDDAGLEVGDVVALLSDNTPETYEVYWAALRSGLYITAVNHHLSAEEASLHHRRLRREGAGGLGGQGRAGRRGSTSTWRPAWPTAARSTATRRTRRRWRRSRREPLAEQPHGDDLLYSSGTTGRPKGIKPPLPPIAVDEPGYIYPTVFGALYGFDEDTVYLSPAPVYHAAPLRFGGVIHTLGGTLVMMEKFDAEGALRAIERHRVTHTQMVPTMFVRMLKLPDDVRASYDVSSLRVVVHAAAPCPVDVKRRMIEWLGPIVHEYYASTEANGATFIDSQAWLEQPGSVGTALMGVIRICGDDGSVLGPGRGRHGLLRARAADLQLPQRPGEDRVHAAPRARQLDDGRRPRLPRRGRLPLPHRPQGVHDHLRRGEHLPAGDRGPLQPAPGGHRHRRDRRARRRDGGAGRGVRRGRPRRCPATSSPPS